MSDSLKALVLGAITVATVTVFVLPRSDRPTGEIIKSIGQYMRWAISYATGGQDIPNISERD